MDKTPAWLNWAAMQAVMLDADFMQKINIAIGGITGSVPTDPAESKPRTMTEEMQALKAFGLRVGRKP